jgi:hypothetical protein
MTLWQELQEIVPSMERRGSKKSIFPKSILAEVIGLSAGTGALLGKGFIANAEEAPKVSMSNNIFPRYI